MVQFQGFNKVGLVVLAMGFLQACTRPEANVSKLSVTIPNHSKLESTLSGAELGHLVINVTGPNISSPILYIWDRHENNSAFQGGVLTFDVPTGKDRLVQVLAVYMDQTAGRMTFYYGDKVAEFSKLDEQVVIPVADLGQTADVVSGSIAGRILDRTVDGAEGGPSGEVLIKMQVPGGRPALILERSFILNGWFNFFALSGLNLRYEIESTGQALFDGQAVNLQSSIFAPSQRLARTYIPAYKYRENDNSVQVNAEPEIHILGYFGTAAMIGSKLVCYDANGPVESMYRANSSTLDSGSKLQFSYGTTVPTLGDLRNLTAPSTVVYHDGGLAKSDAACDDYETNPNVAMYSSVIPLTADMFGNGRDNVAGFRGAFGRVSQSTPTQFAPNGPALALGTVADRILLSGKFLPGAKSIFPSVRIYLLPALPNGDEYRFERAPCGQFANGGFGASARGNATVAADGTFAADSGVTIAESGAGGVMAMCFVRADGSLNPWGAMLYGNNGNNNGGPIQPYLRIESIDGSFGRSGMADVLTRDFCHSVRVRVYGPGGSAYNVSQATTITGLPITGDLRFYSESTCSTLISSANIPISTSESGILYVKGTAVAAGTLLSTLQISGDPEVEFTPANHAFNVEAPIISLRHPEKMLESACYKVDVSRQLANKAPYTQNAPVNFALSFLSNPATVFATEGDCLATTPATTATLASGIASASFWTVYHTSGTGAATVTATGFFGYTRPIQVEAGADQAVSLRTTIDNPLFVGQCHRVRIALVNDTGAEVVARTSIPVFPALPAHLGRLFGDANCYGTIASPLTIYPEQSGLDVYVKPFVDGTALSITFPIAGLPTYPTAPPTPALPANYVKLEPPTLPSAVLGSTEFVAISPQIILTRPAGANLTCQEFNGAIWSPCAAGQLVGSTFTWSLAKAVAKTKFRFRSDMPGQLSSEQEFDPVQYYGPHFDVVMCDVTLNGAESSSTLSAALGSVNNVCLGSAATIACESPLNINAGKRLIGYSSRNTVSIGGTTPGVCVQVNPNPNIDTDMVLANLLFSLDPGNVGGLTSGAVAGLRISGGTSGSFPVDVRVSNLGFSMVSRSANVVTGMIVEQNSSWVSVKARGLDFNMSAQYAGTFGVKVYNTHSGVLEIKKSGFFGNTPIYRAEAIHYNKIDTFTASAPLVVAENIFNGTNMDVIRTVASSTGRKDIQFAGNRVTIPGDANEVITLQGGTSTFINNRFVFSGSSSTSGFVKLLSEANPTSVTFTLNRFNRQGLGHAIDSQPATSQNINLVLDSNSFLSTRSSGPDDGLVVNSITSGITNLASLHATALPRNKICEQVPGSGWNATPTVGVSVPGNTFTTVSTQAANDDSCY